MVEAKHTPREQDPITLALQQAIENAVDLSDPETVATDIEAQHYAVMVGDEILDLTITPPIIRPNTAYFKMTRRNSAEKILREAGLMAHVEEEELARVVEDTEHVFRQFAGTQIDSRIGISFYRDPADENRLIMQPHFVLSNNNTSPSNPLDKLTHALGWPVAPQGFEGLSSNS